MDKFRKVSFDLKGQKVDFVQTNCLLYPTVCKKYLDEISFTGDYPAIIFNGKNSKNKHVTRQFFGSIDKEDIQDFFSEINNPILIEITKDNFKSKIENRKIDDPPWLVIFNRSDYKFCPKCAQGNVSITVMII